VKYTSCTKLALGLTLTLRVSIRVRVNPNPNSLSTGCEFYDVTAVTSFRIQLAMLQLVIL